MGIKRKPFFIVICDSCHEESDKDLWMIAAGEAYCKPEHVLQHEGWRISLARSWNGRDEYVCPMCAGRRDYFSSST